MKYLSVFFISMVPLIELRGAIPIALSIDLPAIPSIAVCRGIGVATIVFGLNFIPFELFTAWWHWALFIGACAVGIALVFFLAYRLNKHLSKKKAEKAAE